MKISNSSFPNQNINTKNISFSSSAGELNRIISNGKKHLVNFAEPGRQGAMSRNLFVANAFAFLLSGRLINSRDTNERRETLTRDIPTIVIAVQGVPFFEKLVAKLAQNKTGFAIMNETVDPKGMTKPKYSVASCEQLKDWYIFDSKIPSGFKGFVERLDSLHGNYKKIFSKLNPQIAEQLRIYSNDNKKFIQEISDNKTLMAAIENEFKNVKNKALVQAGFVKAFPKVAGFVLTLGLIGIFIPKLNIFMTELINKNKAKEMADKKARAQVAENPNTPILNDAIKSAQNSSSIKTKETFAYFLGDKKS